MAKIPLELKLKKARANLIMAQPFFGTLALRLKMEECSSIKTMETDGVKISYNPKYADELSLQELEGVIASCCLHVGLLHHTRRGAREIAKWNKACDYTINPILSNAGFTLPSDKYTNPQYAGMSAEHVYSILPDDPGPGGGSGGGGGGDDSDNPSDPGGNGGVQDSPNSQNKGASQSQEQREESEWKTAMAQAAHAAKSVGKLPQELERLLEEILKPVLPWKDILRRFMTEKANDDFNWNRPNRRFIANNIYIPNREAEGSGEIVVVIDTSGSIGQEELNSFGAEVRSIVDEVRPTVTHVIYCDAQVNKVVSFPRGEELEFELVGGGGTDFRPPFYWIEENQALPKALVYLTDGYGPFPDQEPEYPVMWAITNYEVTPPWGEHLVMEV